MAAHAGRVELVAIAGTRRLKNCRGIDDRAHLVVVPAIRVIIEDDDRRGLPERRLHNRIHRVDKKRLLQQRVGVAGMTVLRGNRFHKTDRRQIAGRKRIKEIVQIVLVVRAVVRGTDYGDRTRPQMLRIGGRGVVLKKRVMRDVVLRRV